MNCINSHISRIEFYKAHTHSNVILIVLLARLHVFDSIRFEFINFMDIGLCICMFEIWERCWEAPVHYALYIEQWTLYEESMEAWERIVAWWRSHDSIWFSIIIIIIPYTHRIADSYNFTIFVEIHINLAFKNAFGSDFLTKKILALNRYCWGFSFL